MSGSRALRLSDTERLHIKTNHPNSVPVFVLRGTNIQDDIPHLKKQKFLVPRDLTVGQFVYLIRRQLSLTPEKSIFVFVGNTLPPSSALIRDLYAQYVDDDGALRMTYSSESVFGSYELSHRSDDSLSLRLGEF